jgi:hypothetical protein
MQVGKGLLPCTVNEQLDCRNLWLELKRVTWLERRQRDDRPGDFGGGNGEHGVFENHTIGSKLVF